MTGFMLALAGLTCGDGGPGAGAAPVRTSAGRWVGTFKGRSAPEGVPVEWDNDRGKLTLEVHRQVIPVEPAHFAPVAGHVLLTLRGRPVLARCEWRAGEVRLYMGPGEVMTLRPAPRKP